MSGSRQVLSFQFPFPFRTSIVFIVLTEVLYIILQIIYCFNPVSTCDVMSEL